MRLCFSWLFYKRLKSSLKFSTEKQTNPMKDDRAYRHVFLLSFFSFSIFPVPPESYDERWIANLLTIVKRRKQRWYGHVSRSSGLAKTTLQGTVKGGRRQGGQRKRWEDNIREWTGLEFGKSQRAVKNRGKLRKLVAKSFVVPNRPSRLRDWWWRWWYIVSGCKSTSFN